MTTEEFSTELFRRMDDVMTAVGKMGQSQTQTPIKLSAAIDFSTSVFTIINRG